MSSKRERELKQLIYLKNELIKETKKELKQYRDELREIESSNNKQKTKKGNRRYE